MAGKTVRVALLALSLSLLAVALILAVLGYGSSAGPYAMVGGVLAAIWVAVWKDWRDNQKRKDK
ncbi:hypothetical protein [Streptomyces sp. NPDC058475]|uniref:hypothetical protein n=1 Tax=Streptomyces sp. NPDC058475 TaxID=3346518 RepID=UPI00364CE17E